MAKLTLDGLKNMKKKGIGRAKSQRWRQGLENNRSYGNMWYRCRCS